MCKPNSLCFLPFPCMSLKNNYSTKAKESVNCPLTRQGCTGYLGTCHVVCPYMCSVTWCHTNAKWGPIVQPHFSNGKQIKLKDFVIVQFWFLIFNWANWVFIISNVSIRSVLHYIVQFLTPKSMWHTWHWFYTKLYHIDTKWGHLDTDGMINTLTRKKF